MTDNEFQDEFCTKFAKRWPFYELTEERIRKLRFLFSKFPISVAQSAIERHDCNNPDLNGRTFALKPLLDECYNQSAGLESDFTWFACHEAEWSHYCYQLCQAQWPEVVTIQEFAINVLGKVRGPRDSERDKALATLRSMGARPPEEIAGIQRENAARYDRFYRLQQAAQHELRNRNRGKAADGKEQKQEAKEPQPVSTFLARAMRMNRGGK